MKRVRGMFGTLALAGAIAAAGCGDMSRTGRSPAFLIIDGMDGARGSGSAQFRTPLLSDVVTNVQQQVGTQTVVVPTAYNDLGRVTLRVALKDPGTTASPSQPSALNSITISRYRVNYVRADGRNTPGVDVPYPFDGAMTVTISGNSQSSGIFEVVRVQSKLEAPLRALRGGGGAIAINTLAEVTFYGRDQAGNEVQVTGTLQVNFADWADED